MPNIASNQYCAAADHTESNSSSLSYKPSNLHVSTTYESIYKKKTALEFPLNPKLEKKNLKLFTALCHQENLSMSNLCNRLCQEY
jgi:hypothetical protein